MRPRATSSAKPATTATELGALEGRIAPRHDLASLAWFRSVEVLADERHDIVEGVARSIDVSRGGFGLVTSVPVPKGSLLFLELTVRRTGPDGERTQSTMHCLARVMHCSSVEDGTFRVGIRVDLVPPSERALLEWLLNQ